MRKMSLESAKEALLVTLSDTFPLALILLVDGYANDYRLALHDDAKRELQLRAGELGPRLELINEFFDRMAPTLCLTATTKTVRVRETFCEDMLSVGLEDFRDELQLYGSDAHISAYWELYLYLRVWRGKKIAVFPRGQPRRVVYTAICASIGACGS
jgi:hypothetical protein